MAVLKHVLVPVDDIDAAIEFYRARFGFALKFRDADRYAALDAGGVTIGLVSGDEALTQDKVAMSICVDDVDAMVEHTQAAGGAIILGAQQGPHERRAVISDPDGHPVVVYSKG